MLHRSLLILLLALFATIGTLVSTRRAQSDPALRRITRTREEALNLNPTLSGDGSTITFESTEDLSMSGGPPQMRGLRADVGTDQIAFSQIAVSRLHTAAISQHGTHVVFASNEDLTGGNPDRNSEIFLRHDQELTQLTNTNASAVSRLTAGSFAPSISDDARLFTFASTISADGVEIPSRIVLFDVSRRVAQDITMASDSAATSPKLSGDGRKLVYIRNQDELVIKDLIDGTTKTIVQDQHRLSFSPARAISDDGNRTVFSAEIADGQSQVFLYDEALDLTRQITALAARQDDVPLNPTISGNGKRIVFATRRNVLGGNSDRSVELYLFDIPTGVFTRLTDAPSQAHAEVTESLNDSGTEVVFNFARVLTNVVSDSDFANNPEIYLLSLPARPAFGELQVMNAASMNKEPAPEKAVAPGSIATARGNALAHTSAQAFPTDGVFPMSVAGTTATVNGIVSQLLYVSPEEVVFVVPPTSPLGPAELVITNSDGFSSKTVVSIASAAPGVFTISGDGSGPALGLNADTLAGPPFDPGDDKLRLIIFATGLNTSRDFMVTADGINLPIESIVESADLPGLMEIHLKVPAPLAGAGALTTSLIIDGRTSNPFVIELGGSFLRDIMLNEVLADPPDGIAGDANRDGTRDAADDEFVELVNRTPRDIDLNGYELWTRGLNTPEVRRHRFVRGDIFPAGTAIVVFGGGNPTGSFAGAQVYKASSGSLSLQNSGGVVSLRDSSGAVVTFQSYGGNTGLRGDQNQSVTRNPDISGTFVLHGSINGLPFSPGSKVDDTAFAPYPAVLQVIVQPPSITSLPGQSMQFHATATGDGGSSLEGVLFSWRSSNTNVATIDADGRATSLASGTAEITAIGRRVASAPAVITVATPTPTPTPVPSPSPLPSPTVTPTPSPTASPTPMPSPTAQPSASPTPSPISRPSIVISELRTRGPNGASDEFVELYNNSDDVVDVSGWKLRGSSSTGSISTRLTISAGTRLEPRSHFLVVNSSGYSGTTVGDQTFTSGIANDGGVALTLPNDVVVDQVGFSAGSAFKEGMHLAPLPSDANQSYERKPGGAFGSTQDSSDNFADFILITPSDPQNKNSSPTPGPSPSPTPFPTATPFASPSPSATPSPSPSPFPSPSPSSTSTLVISQVYGGGGNSGAPFQNDFIEIFNNGRVPVSLDGWSLQYASATGSTWSVTNLTGITLQPGFYFLIQEASGGMNGGPLPIPDVTGAINMAATAGKVALVNTTTALSGACPNATAFVDMVGYGSTASCFRGPAPAAAGSNTLAIVRKGRGCEDTQNNANDFISGAPIPHNIVTPANVCGSPSNEVHHLDDWNAPLLTGVMHWLRPP